jgi:protocatechuate 3,4-dioxygenase beta subunit
VATLVTADEPGEKLIISGTVYAEKGGTPLPGFVLYLYQTDATGVYNTTDGSWQGPRIRGWVRTDSDGKYEIRTIKPGSYPGSRNPAHIHVIVKPPGKDPDWIDDFLFEGDPFLTDKDRGRLKGEETFSPVMKVTRDESGMLHCRRDIMITSSEE